MSDLISPRLNIIGIGGSSGPGRSELERLKVTSPISATGAASLGESDLRSPSHRRSNAERAATSAVPPPGIRARRAETAPGRGLGSREPARARSAGRPHCIYG
jgi:hypothetical protein